MAMGTLPAVPGTRSVGSGGKARFEKFKRQKRVPRKFLLFLDM